jgi:hypothetical protein
MSATSTVNGISRDIENERKAVEVDQFSWGNSAI